MRSKQTTFYCFSPPIMMATFAVEVGLLVYVVVRYKMTPAVRLVATMLLSLAIFQLAEYNVCEGDGVLSGLWSRIGFVAITLLPVFGLHLAQLIARRSYRKLTIAAYLTALIWSTAFGLSNWAFLEQVCMGNYIIFRLKDNVAFYYSIYYYGWILASLVLCAKFWSTPKNRVRSSVKWLAVGYLTFLIPTATVNLINSETTAGIPSIMCGFAVLFALILATKIIPAVENKR